MKCKAFVNVSILFPREHRSEVVPNGITVATEMEESNLEGLENLGGFRPEQYYATVIFSPRPVSIPREELEDSTVLVGPIPAKDLIRLWMPQEAQSTVAEYGHLKVVKG